MWVISAKKSNYEVGYYRPDNVFESLFSYDNEDQAVHLCSRLNGAPDHQLREVIEDICAALEQISSIQTSILDLLKQHWGRY